LLPNTDDACVVDNYPRTIWQIYHPAMD